MAGISDIMTGNASGNPWSQVAPALATQTGSGFLSGLVNGFFQKRAQKRQFEYQQKLMDKEHQMELENLAAQDKYQRELVVDSNSMLKKSLQQAGYSTADPNGTGVTPAQISGPSTSVTGSAGSFPISATPSFNYSDLVAASNVQSQTRLNDIESRYRARLLEGQIGEYNAKIDVMKSKLPAELDLLKQEFLNRRAELRLTDKQIDQLNSDIDRLKVLTEGIRIDNKYKDNLNDAQVRKISNEASLLAKEGRIKEVEALLADKGILVGADWFTQLAAISSRGGSEDIINSLVNLVERVSASLPSVASKLFGSISDNIMHGVLSGFDKFKELWNKKF